MRLNELSTDLGKHTTRKRSFGAIKYSGDGLRLIALVEVLAQKHLGKFNKRPTFRQMKMENVALALNFLENERIKEIGLICII